MKKIFLGFLFLLSSFSIDAKEKLFSQWLEIGPDNRLIVRAVIAGEKCPLIKAVPTNIQMDVHSKKDKNFPTICQGILPPQTTYASLEGHVIPLPKADPQKILIIGDTGCRMEAGKKEQDCSDPTQWPFPVIAKKAAKFKPDLVIHVGDYLYRESLGNPHGDNWKTWQEDFFKPAKPLLKTTPWIFVRGNHESCERSGQGWTKLLDPFSFNHCNNHSPLYSLMIGDTRAFIIDSANANDVVAPADQVDLYKNYLSAITKSTAPQNWIITHKPFWFIFDDDTLNQTYQTHFLNTLQTAWMNINPPNVDLLLSGHIHRFQSINFPEAQNRAPQVIVGASGTRLDQGLNRTDLKGLNIAGETIEQGVTLIKFGYMTLEKNGKNWHAQLRGIDGKIMVTCEFRGKQFICHE